MDLFKEFLLPVQVLVENCDEALKQHAEPRMESYILCEDLSFNRQPKMCSVHVHAGSYLVSHFKQLGMFRGWLKSIFCKLSHLIPFLWNTVLAFPSHSPHLLLICSS